MSTHSPKSEALRALYWRSEILRLMFWLRGEGFGDVVDVPTLERYLGVDGRVGLAHLEGLVQDGLVVRDGKWYALSAAGLVEGEEEYLTAFSDLLRPAHGECSPECWCQMSDEEAAACTAQRNGRGQRERKPPPR
jgi:hypothetical protein